MSNFLVFSIIKCNIYVQANIFKILYSLIQHYFPSNNIVPDLMKIARTNTGIEIVSEIA